ncbi:MAG TPA: UDP-N-acetylmuramoyl-tripeptide--D-alanyl-D-alanine ligase [Bacteroidales bacterium]|mgnify:FL=1|nr:UDP-N-acetylmuramoyl-tripeptide--D-alanyl-D-alanine ligase [Bacteroidales bacterium]HPB25698.1 UDP-N-acetylmuramoyl-tripeptide--D-alanyl-D-alanine ligase [Bacteroidales bacterium]HQN16265.1 UDP-N-acetylmuramoyl-tripeptide--D-alanyl-D-alanine ligase [Bacteroidales bacterium]HQP15827.1 UDP-N-acetylmuramoyl-tripeptide--D-alanyl-D-alanine ligase [Bacteroidales bacterium]
MNIEQLYNIFLEHPAISTDTRKLTPDSLFFALKGEHFNGNKFAKQALDQGVAYAIIDEKEYVTGDKTILVDNTLECLQKLAAFHRSKLTIPVIGISGSNGKTTSKELIHTVLAEKFNVFSTQGNLNNHIGVPLSVLQITPSHEIAVIEMGANHVGEIQQLCTISQPNYGLITNVGKAHLEGFGNFENVIKAKTELYRYLEQQDGLVFINFNNATLKAHAHNIRQYSYGTNQQANIHTTFIVANPYVKLYWEDKKTIIESKLIGKYNFENILCAIAVGDYFQVSPEQIKHAVEIYFPSNSRSEFIHKEDNTIILDAYNANPTSMIAALENFNLMQSTNKVVMLGDMLELGAYKKMEHEKIIEFLNNSNYNQVFLVGSNFYEANTRNDFLTFKSSQLLRDHLKAHPLHDALILVKGSRGTQMEHVLSAL